MTRLEWISFNYRWVPIVSAAFAIAAVSYAAFFYLGVSGLPKDGLILFLFVTKLVVPVILAGIGAPWLAVQVLYWWYDRRRAHRWSIATAERGTACIRGTKQTSRRDGLSSGPTAAIN